MDELAAGLSRITLGLEVAKTYEKAFDEIVSFAENVRAHRIPLDELVVTKTLARPFIPGGLFVLLTEPRSYHPWDKGINSVIATCNTLDSLSEGIQIGSKGHLILKDDVSVLDLRPFLPKRLQPTLRDSEWEALNDLIFSAIEAKKPEVLLCMGDDATNALKAWIDTPQARIGQRHHGTEIVYAMHPSRSVNHNKTDADMREKLFQSICEACDKLHGRFDVSILEEVPAPGPLFAVSENTRCLEKFLEVVLMSCFLPQHQLPGPNIVMGERRRYKLETWHEKWFRHMEKYLDSTEHREHQARASLIPVFKQFNKLLKRASWFLPIYEVVDWPGVCQVFAERLLTIEYACYLLAGDTAVDISFPASRDNASVRQELGHVLTRMEEITAHVTKLWEDRRPHRQRMSCYIGFGDEA